MALYRNVYRHSARRGIILMVVVVMLGLFATIGVAFVLYAEAEANASRVAREAQQRSHTNSPAGNAGDTNDAAPIATDIFNQAMAQLIYDRPDDSTGIYSAIRGGSFARTAFGAGYTGPPQSPTYTYTYTATNGTIVTVPFNGIPFNGIGTSKDSTLMPGILAGTARNFIVNNTYFPVNGDGSSDGILFDPERLGYRTAPTDPSWICGGTKTQQNYFPVNASYTYPDEKDIYLAAVDPTSGQVLVQSFYRPWIFGSLNPSNNANWTNKAGKYLIQRPRPFDHQWPLGSGISAFPYPPPNADGSYTGDIQQLEGASVTSSITGQPVRQNDSMWMDLDLPVKTWKGKTYKPLVAFLIVDLDGRINVNVAGNKKGPLASMTNPNSPQASNQGWGPWEMNLSSVLNRNSTDWQTILNSRYGNDGLPNRAFTTNNVTQDLASGGQMAPSWSQGDVDGSQATNPLPMGALGQMALPLPGSSSGTYYSMPSFPANYQDGMQNSAFQIGTSLANERDYHPSLYNPYLLGSIGSLANGSDRTFSPGELRYLNYKFNGDDANYGLAALGALAPTNLGMSIAAGTFNPRFAITTVSNDFDRMGITPWLFNQPTSYSQNPSAGPPAQFNPLAAPGLPTGAPVGFPPVSSRTNPPNPYPTPGSVMDFVPTTWKAIASTIGSINLNRKLSDYRVDPTQAFNATVNGKANVTAASAQLALNDRVQFATDIFNRFCVACGTQLTASGPASGTPQYNALRFLAQLSVNLVDYIDNDDYITPFAWNGAYVGQNGIVAENLYGTELPRLVINEACAQATSTTMNQVVNGVNITQVSMYNVNIWLELLNPVTTQGAPAQVVSGMSYSGGAPLWVNNSNTGGNSSVYKILVTGPDATLRNSTNYTGTPTLPIASTVTLTNGNFPQQVAPPSNGQYGSYNGGNPTNKGFVMFGPQNLPGSDNIVPTATIQQLQYSYAVPNGMGLDGATNNPLTPPTLILQRLCCPELAFNAVTNPYITVDYFAFKTGQVNDARTYTYVGQNVAANMVNPAPTLNTQYSYGRRQPYAGYAGSGVNPNVKALINDTTSQIVGQAINPPPAMNTTMNHTFFRHNGASANGQAGWNNMTNSPNTDILDYQFEWLVQLDRAPLSPIEALYVSAYRPWELTQQFIFGGPWWSGYTNPTTMQSVPGYYRHRHMAVWDDNTTRLFRALSLFETSNRTLGMGMGGRIPGKVNINTIWDKQGYIFQSICDPNANQSNYFNSGTATTVWQSLMNSRTPTGVPGQNDQPFWGLGLPIAPLDSTNTTQFPSTQFPYGVGVENTIFRHTAATVGSTFPGGTAQKLTDNTAQTHPYLVNELLMKSYNNLTTRSNTFAVWMTIGYFEVVNPGPYNDQNRPILGQELGINEGSNVRHKFFSIVDRTKLTMDLTQGLPASGPALQGTSPVYFPYEPVLAQPLTNDPVTDNNMGAVTVTVNVPATFGNGNYLTGIYDGVPWTITVGSTLTIAPDSTAFGAGNPLAPANAYQQTATVTGLSFAQGTPGTSSNTATLTLSLLGGNVQACRGSVMILNQTPGQPTAYGTVGNPGPQNGFNYRDPRYSAVVPYAAQIK